MPYTLWTSRQEYDVCMRKLTLIFALLIFSCSSNQPTAEIPNEDTVTTSNKIVKNTTTTTVISDEEIDLMRENFKEAWEKSLKEPIELSAEEIELTEYLYSLWTWKGDKWTPENENFYELKINDQICRRIWSSMGYAWLDQVHPVENLFTNGYVATERYVCKPDGDFTENSLFGAPFYYQEKWWIYQGYDFSWDQIDCKNPCGSSIGYFGTRVPIDLDDEIYNVSLPDN